MASTPYYTLSSFNLLGSVALLYSAATNLFFGVTRRKIERLPPPVPQQPRRPRPYSCGSASDGVAIVTGCNTGIGYETARSLVQDYGFTVVMACRSRDKAQAAAQQINQHSGGENNGGKAVFVHPLDLSSFDSVRSFCKQVKDQFKQIHVLINNAGRNTNGVSDDSNLDLLFQSNFLGHYLLTSLLMDNMAENARIVNLSSVMHHFCAGSALDSVEFWKKTAVAGEQPRNTYSLSKLAALLFTVALNQRYRNIRSYAVSPGSV